MIVGAKLFLAILVKNIQITVVSVIIALIPNPLKIGQPKRKNFFPVLLVAKKSLALIILLMFWSVPENKEFVNMDITCYLLMALAKVELPMNGNCWVGV